MALFDFLSGKPNPAKISKQALAETNKVDPRVAQFWQEFSKLYANWDGEPSIDKMEAANNLLHVHFPQVICEVSQRIVNGNAKTELVLTPDGNTAVLDDIFALAKGAPRDIPIVLFRSAFLSNDNIAMNDNQGNEVTVENVTARIVSDQSRLSLILSYKGFSEKDLSDSRKMLMLMLAVHTLGELRFMASFFNWGFTFDGDNREQEIALHDVSKKLDEIWQKRGRDGHFSTTDESKFTVLRGTDGDDNPMIVTLNVDADRLVGVSEYYNTLIIENSFSTKDGLTIASDFADLLASCLEVDQTGLLTHIVFLPEAGERHCYFKIKNADAARLMVDLCRAKFKGIGEVRQTIEADPSWAHYLLFA
ncbi:hypothetical protein [Bartonella sp. HY406]|uniref:hypothetical protein n=1 Tax=Bartonella sp. HY406 TaxID=2979331 RepID=UPI0021C6D76C|nr:hypothetical protein [Bartonella sp. HY406]UXN04454.1 hypothetical protein N6B01_05405 [Bartonella sp. HY406]